MFIRVGDVKKDDVIVLSGADFQVHDATKYKKQGRVWVTLCIEVDGKEKDVAMPADVIITWRGTALF